MSKQTAVYTLVEILIQEFGFDADAATDVIQQALQMEREQMKLIYDGLLQNVGTSIKESDLPTFEQYYNETFEK
jgi:hypothetical protein